MVLGILNYWPPKLLLQRPQNGVITTPMSSMALRPNTKQNRGKIGLHSHENVVCYRKDNPAGTHFLPSPCVSGAKLYLKGLVNFPQTQPAWFWWNVWDFPPFLFCEVSFHPLTTDGRTSVILYFVWYYRPDKSKVFSPHFKRCWLAK